MEYMMPPITMCVNGHNICNICKTKLNDCPTCGKQFLTTRNVGLETLARDMNFPCAYRKLGCNRVFAHDKLNEHTAICRYGKLKCPTDRLSSIWEQKCGWTGKYNEVKNHLMEKHLEDCIDYGEVESRSFHNHGTPAWFNKYVFVYDEVFFRKFDDNNGIFYVDLQYIGPAENAAKYKYKVKFVNEDNTEGVTVMHLARSFDEECEKVFKLENCGTLQSDVVKRLKTPQGCLKFKLEILKVCD
jgi:hypothetical protein